MESLIIYPDSPKQYEVLKAFLEEMKIHFSIGWQNVEPKELEQWQKDMLDKRLESIEQGNFKEKKEAHKIFDKCFK